MSLWKRHKNNLEAFLKTRAPDPELDLNSRLQMAKFLLEHAGQDGYLTKLQGTIGADPSVERSS